MDIITGYTGKPHVTSEQDRDINIGIFGSGSYVLPTGSQLVAEISSNNEIKIRDGVIMHQGCAASIKKNSYDSLTITNGSQGMKRTDLIVARYEINQDTAVESITLKVIQGTPAASDPTVPAHKEGDIQAGDAVVDMPLYHVQIDGLNIKSVDKQFKVAYDLKTVTNDLNDRIKIYKFEEKYDVTGKGTRSVDLSNLLNYISGDVVGGIVQATTSNPSLYFATLITNVKGKLTLNLANNNSINVQMPCSVYVFYR